MDSAIQSYLQEENKYAYLTSAQKTLENACNMWGDMNFIGIISGDGEKSCIKGNYVPNSQISIHTQIFESAFIDGCSRYQIFFKMILPLSKPGLSTLDIYNGVNIWNEFSFAYTLTQSAENRILPLVVWEFQGQYSMNTPMILSK